MRPFRLALGIGLCLTVAMSLALLAYPGPVGLELRAFADPADRERPSVVEAVSQPSTSSVERLTERLGSDNLRFVWSGFLDVPIGGARRLGIAAAGRARLWIDGRLVVEKAPTAETEEAAGTVALDAGPHLVSLQFERGGGRPDVHLRWEDDRSQHFLMAIPTAALSPTALDDRQWQVRRLAPVIVAALALSWLTLLVWVAARILRWSVAGWEALRTDGFRGVALLSGTLFLAGVWWGWPGPTWAVDILEPAGVLDGWSQRFSNGWFSLYPPLQYYLLTLCYLPVVLAARLDLVTVAAEPVFAILQLQGRLVSVAFSMGTVAGVGLLADRLLGRSAAPLCALSAAVFLPLVYYAKTANVDAAYVFWFVWSAVFLADAHRHGRLGDFLGFGVSAALAMAAKDQAYGLYLFPVVHLAIVARRHAPRLVAGGAAAVATFALCHNLPLNWSGFLAHVDLLTGPASADFRMFDNSVVGQARLLVTTFEQLGLALGWSGSAAVAVGVWAGVRSTRHRLPLWTWLTIASYYVTLLAVVGYTYDRFLLPITVVLALPAGAGLRWLLESRAWWRLGPAVAVGLLVWMGGRAASIDYLMIRDSRIATEAWLEEVVPPGASVALIASLFPNEYLPHLDRFRRVPIRPGITETLAAAPDFIVLNLEQMARDLDDPVRRAWFEWLEGGRGPYQRLFHAKTPLGWWPLGWDRRFTDTLDDPLTNLDKINPAMAVYGRQDVR